MNNQTAIFLSQWNDSIPEGSGLMLQSRLEKLDESKVSSLAMVSLKSPIIGLILGLFFGALGIDRFYKGDIGLGILKFLSIFIFIGIFWALADLYFVWQGIKKDNLNKINQQLMMLGV
ncbi:NINE protein [Helicobacter labetoulli]|uniref:NINE protein n=1 Tax=Helicobacter labetoulli TaxID=2315333 RepID=UPI000EF66249|nr:TM2 domain-containing protein [Helicobacter labetoulli]